MSYRVQGAKWDQADEGNIWVETSHLSKCEMSSSDLNLEIIIKSACTCKLLSTIWESSSISGKGSRLNNGILEACKEQSGVKPTKEIFEWKPVIYRNVKCHLAIVIRKSF